MGFGCNAVGVTGARIIDSPRERIIAAVTNSFAPCNGRFPMIISIICMFFAGSVSGVLQNFVAAGILSGFIVLSLAMMISSSYILSKTLLKGEKSSFVMELPAYRAPQVGKVIVRSVFDRIVFVLARAVGVAAPAGLVIWLMANVRIGSLSILGHCADFLEPIGSLLGMDGVILLAFILALPANEIVLPIAFMAYTSGGVLDASYSGQVMYEVLAGNGWTWKTAFCVIIFSLMHWPCSTTLLTVKKELGSWKWAAVSFFVPLVFGVALCLIFNAVCTVFGL